MGHGDQICIVCQQRIPIRGLVALGSDVIDVCKSCWAEMPISDRLDTAHRIRIAEILDRIGGFADTLSDAIERSGGPALGDLFRPGGN